VGWHELTLRLPAEGLERAEALLRLAGAVSIAIADDGDAPLFEPAPETAPLWPSLKVSALFDEPVNIEAIGRLLDPLARDTVAIEQIDDKALARSAREPIRPAVIGPRLEIVPANSLAAGDPRALGLHMGLAFGTGRHPTTRLCLEWLERELEPGLTVLDYGTGSGILALAALKLGARHATAVDNEPQALTATRRNAMLNGLESSIRAVRPEALGQERFDLILANILAEPLIGLADEFAARQTPGNRVVLSGVLVGQLDALESSYRDTYVAFTRHTRSGWGLLTAERRSGYDR
jgi:ribosomal protein L11 methyltransferase